MEMDVGAKRVIARLRKTRKRFRVFRALVLRTIFQRVPDSGQGGSNYWKRIRVARFGFLVALLDFLDDPVVDLRRPVLPPSIVGEHLIDQEVSRAGPRRRR